MAFAIASGLTPQAGIHCAIITGFLISLLGGSRYQIGGAREQPAALMKAAELHRHLGKGNICQNILTALERAEELHRTAA